MTAQHLHAQQGVLQTGLGHEGLADGRQERQLILGIGADSFVVGVMGVIQQLGGVVGQCPVALVEGLHGQQHAPHIRVHDNRVSSLVRFRRARQRAHLQPVFRIGQSILVGHLAMTQTLHAGTQTGAVHHGEHAGQPLVDFADQKAGGAVEVHHAGSGGLDAHLVFDGTADHGIALALLTGGVGQELGHDEQRDTPGASRGVGQFGQHQVDDILGHVMLAGGDEDLGAGDRIGTVGLGHRTGLDQAQIGTAVWLGQAHGAGPVAGHQLVQVQLLLFLRTMGADRRGAAVGQAGVHVPGIVGRSGHFIDHQPQGSRQTLTTELHRPAHGGPAVVDILLVGFLEALGRGYHAIIEVAAFLISGAVQRSQHLAGKLRAFFQHRIDQIRGGISQTMGRIGTSKIKHFVHDKAHIAQRGGITRHHLLRTIGGEGGCALFIQSFDTNAQVTGQSTETADHYTA